VNPEWQFPDKLKRTRYDGLEKARENHLQGDVKSGGPKGFSFSAQKKPEGAQVCEIPP